MTPERAAAPGSDTEGERKIQPGSEITSEPSEALRNPYDNAPMPLPAYGRVGNAERTCWYLFEYVAIAEPRWPLVGLLEPWRLTLGTGEQVDFHIPDLESLEHRPKLEGAGWSYVYVCGRFANEWPLLNPELLDAVHVTVPRRRRTTVRAEVGGTVRTWRTSQLDALDLAEELAGANPSLAITVERPS